MEIDVVETWERKGIVYYRLSLPGALNSPILKLPTGDTVVKSVRRPSVGGRCEIYPNHNVRKDGTCMRAHKCTMYKKACLAK